MGFFDTIATSLHVPVENVYATTLLVLCLGIVWLFIDKQRGRTKRANAREQAIDQASLSTIEVLKTIIDNGNNSENRFFQLLEKLEHKVSSDIEDIKADQTKHTSAFENWTGVSAQRITTLKEQLDSNTDQALRTINTSTNTLANKIDDTPSLVWIHEAAVALIKQTEAHARETVSLKLRVAAVETALVSLDNSVTNRIDESEQRLMDILSKRLTQAEADRDSARSIAAREKQRADEEHSKRIAAEQQVKELQALITELSKPDGKVSTLTTRLNEKRVTSETPKAGDA